MNWFLIGKWYLLRFTEYADLEHYCSMLLDTDIVIIFDSRMRLLKHYAPIKTWRESR